MVCLSPVVGQQINTPLHVRHHVRNAKEKIKNSDGRRLEKVRNYHRVVENQCWSTSKVIVLCLHPCKCCMVSLLAPMQEMRFDSLM